MESNENFNFVHFLLDENTSDQSDKCDSEFSDVEPEIPDYIGDSSESGESDDEAIDPLCTAEMSEQAEFEAAEKSNNEMDVDLSMFDTYYVGRDGATIWTKSLMKKIGKRSMPHHAPIVKKLAREAKTPIECWELFFPGYIIEDIVKFTNIKLESLGASYLRSRDCKLTNVIELRAVLGLLYLAGLYNITNGNSIRDLWSNDGTAPDYFRCVMSINRFTLLLRALRFDDIKTRKERLSQDKLAPIRDIWENFNEMCQEMYSPGSYLTIDEMMTQFTGRCSFKQYLPKKSATYGLKSFALIDADNSYTIKIEMYLGEFQDPALKSYNKPTNVVKRIAQPVFDTGRNLTINKKFTTISLAKELLRKHKTTIVGKIRQNKAELPSAFVKIKDRSSHSSLFGFQKDIALVSYVPKKNNNILLLSSCHDSLAIENGKQMKPKIISLFNKTKGTVEIIDNLRRDFTISKCAKRWPLAAFFTLMHLATINSYVIFHNNTKRNMVRREFIKAIAQDLAQLLLAQRAAIPTLPIDMRTRIKRYANIDITEETDKDPPPSNPGLCYLCPRRKNRKSKTKCTDCDKFVCREHTVPLCVKCREIPTENL